VQLTVVDLKNKKLFHHEKLLLPFQMPQLSYTSFRYVNGTKDDVVFKSSDISVEIRNHPDNSNSKAKFYIRNVIVDVPHQNVSFNLRMNVSREQEIIGMLSPLSQDRTKFYYNLKGTNYPVNGTFNYKNDTVEFTPRNALGGSDWGRGVWPYHTFWIWARGQGRLEDNSRFSLNLGGGFQDQELGTATEDAYFINNYIYKLNAAEISYDSNNLLNPWNFKCITDNKTFKECDITYKPSLINKKHTNLGFILSDMQVVYGTFEGWVSDTMGRKTHFSDISGLVEVHKARW